MLQTDFSDLVEQHQGWMYRYAFGMLHNEEDAQDATQDILIKAWKRLQSLQPEKVQAWMFKCLRNLCIDRLRQQKFQSTVLEGDEVLIDTLIADGKGYALCSAETASPEALCLKRERQAVLRRAIAQLPEQFQTVVVLHDLQGIGFKDIAETLGQPIGTVKSNEFRARQKMKTLSVPITSVALLIGFVGISSANEEDDFTVSMTSGDKTYYSDSGYITHTAEVETSHVFAEVDWYVNGAWQTTSKGDGAKKTASFTKGFSGNGYGRNYEIEAVAYSEDGRNASDSHRIRVKKNVVSYDGGSVNDLGYAEITTCGWSGLTSSALMYAEVNNISGAPVSAFYEFDYWVIRVDAATHNPIDNGGLYDANLPAPVPVPVANGSSDRAFFSDSHTITEGDVMAGEKGELGVTITVDVWQDGKSIGSWTASKKKYYTPPQN